MTLYRPLVVPLALAAIPSAGAQISFDPPQSWPAASQPRRVKLGDLNLDGHLDAVVCHDGTNAVHYLHGDGLGGLAPVGSVNLVGVHDVWEIELGDVDNDAFPDLVGGNINTGGVWLGDGAGGFGPVTYITNHEGFWDIELADVNLDGETDMVHSTDIFDIGHVSFGSPMHIEGFPNVGLPSIGGFPEVTIGDLDGVAPPDVVIASGSIRVYLNAGWQVPTVYPSPQVSASNLADLNGDGHLDLFVTAGGALRVHDGDGTGALGSAATYPTVAGAQHVDVGDLNVDGAPDVVVLGNGQIGIHLGPSLALAVSVPTCATTSSHFSLGDLNEDGLLDVAVACRTGGLETHINRSYPEVGTRFCSTNANSTGGAAEIGARGSRIVDVNHLALSAGGLPAGKFGYFLMASSQDFVENFGTSSGNLCLGLPIVRFAQDILFSSPSGTMEFRPDLSNLPQGTVLQPGSTWSFQCWFRDDPTPAGSNTTDGLAITFETAGAPSAQFPAALTQLVEETVQFEVPITLSQPSDQDVAVGWFDAGTATVDVDYRIESPNPLVIPAGSTSASLSVTVVEDAVMEPDEFFTVTIAQVNGGVPGTSLMHTVTILDDD